MSVAYAERRFLVSRQSRLPKVTSSSAVTKTPRDASRLSVVSFNSTALRAQFILIISYFGFGFTGAYNSILLCCLRRNVDRCCHTHDSRTTVTVYSARPRLVGLALYCSHGRTTVTACSAWRLAVRYRQSTKTRPLSAINQPHCSSYRSQSHIFVENRDFSLPDLHFDAPIGGGVPVGILACRSIGKN